MAERRLKKASKRWGRAGGGARAAAHMCAGRALTKDKCSPWSALQAARRHVFP